MEGVVARGMGVYRSLDRLLYCVGVLCYNSTCLQIAGSSGSSDHRRSGENFASYFSLAWRLISSDESSCTTLVLKLASVIECLELPKPGAFATLHAASTIHPT